MRNTALLLLSTLIAGAMVLGYFGYRSANSAAKKHELQMQILRTCAHSSSVADCVVVITSSINHAG